MKGAGLGAFLPTIVQLCSMTDLVCVLVPLHKSLLAPTTTQYGLGDVGDHPQPWVAFNLQSAAAAVFYYLVQWSLFGLWAPACCS